MKGRVWIMGWVRILITNCCSTFKNKKGELEKGGQGKRFFFFYFLWRGEVNSERVVSMKFFSRIRKGNYHELIVMRDIS